jgi:hypothetical protein
MKSIAFQYHRLLVSASDAGLNKIQLRLIPLAQHSVRPIPVTTASQVFVVERILGSGETRKRDPKIRGDAGNRARPIAEETLLFLGTLGIVFSE